MDHSLTTLEEKFKTLPPDVQQAITSVDIAQQLTDIGKAHRLHLDQLDELFDEAGLVMLGLTKPRNFVANLRKRVEISEEDARAIVKTVDAGIFSPIRESLKKIHGVDEATTEEEDLSDEETTLRREDILRDIEDKEEKTENSRQRTGQRTDIGAQKETQEQLPQAPPAANTAPTAPVESRKIPVLPHETTVLTAVTSRLPEINKEDRGAIYYPDIKPEIAAPEQKKESEKATISPAMPATVAVESTGASAGLPPMSAYKEKFGKVIISPKETLAVEAQEPAEGKPASAAPAASDPYREPIA